jgi:hypothetical protein
MLLSSSTRLFGLDGFAMLVRAGRTDRTLGPNVMPWCTNLAESLVKSYRSGKSADRQAAAQDARRRNLSVHYDES